MLELKETKEAMNQICTRWYNYSLSTQVKDGFGMKYFDYQHIENWLKYRISKKVDGEIIEIYIGYDLAKAVTSFNEV